MQNIYRNNVVLIEKTTLFIKKTGSKGESILKRGDRRRKKITKRRTDHHEVGDRRSSGESIFITLRSGSHRTRLGGTDLVDRRLRTAQPRTTTRTVRPSSGVKAPNLSLLLHAEDLSSVIVIRRRFLSEKAERIDDGRSCGENAVPGLHLSSNSR